MRAISLYSGAGGLDAGITRAEFEILWANDTDKNACATYEMNLGDHIRCGDIENYREELNCFVDTDIDLIFGGPPCQGFSVAGKMDPTDPRSKHIWTFCEIVETLSPKTFLMENVSALGKLKKWEPLRKELIQRFRRAGYSANYVVLNASDFDVPQSRERVFFIGFRGDSNVVPDLKSMLNAYEKKAPTVRETLSTIDRAGTGNNTGVCNAKITIAPKPVLRKSPFAGMLFNGLGRPIKLDGYCATLPASMGGNKTPIIDEDELYLNAQGWVQQYHESIMNGKMPLPFQQAPARLRRMTVEEAALMQTFPIDYLFSGPQSSKFRQIGNAVPCNLAFRVGMMIKDYLIENENILQTEVYQIAINTF